MAPLAMTEEGCPCEELSGSVIAGAFWVCHCGGLSLVCHCEGLFCLVIARSEATKQSRLIPRRSPPSPPQIASLRSQRQKGKEAPQVASLRSQRRKGGRPPQIASLRSQRQNEACHCEGLFGSVIAGFFFSCHCEERSDEAISLWPRGPLSLLRFARKDRRGRRPLSLLRSARNDERGASLRGAQRRSNLTSSRAARPRVPLRLLRSARKDKRGGDPLRLLRCARNDERGKTHSDCFAPLATTKGERPPQVASLRSQRRERASSRGPFLSCHCEERSDEAISPHPAPLAPERPLSLLRCARNDGRGCHCEERSDEAISIRWLLLFDPY